MPSRFILNASLSAAALIAGFTVASLSSRNARDLPVQNVSPADAAPDSPADAVETSPTTAAAHTPDEIAQRFTAIFSDANYYRQNTTLALAVSELQAEEVEVALEALSKGKDAAWRRQWFKAALVARWADFDPVAAASYALQQPPLLSRPPDPAIANSFEKWARRDEATALQQAAAIEDPAQQRAAVRGVIAPFMQRDPEAALTWMKSLPVAARDRDFYRAAFSAWGRKDPQAAAQGALDIGDPESRKVALAGVAARWVESSPNSATAWAASLPDATQRDSAQITIFERWAALDPQAAAGGAAPLLPRDANPPQFYYTIVDEMIERDARAALDFARNSADGAEGTRRWVSAISRTAFHDPITALAEAKKLPPGENQTEVFNEIIHYLPQEDSVDDAVKFAIRELPESPARENVVSTGLRTWAGVGDAEAAMNFATSQSNVTPSAVTQTFESWTWNHPDAAMVWAQARPEGPEKKAFIGMALQGLARRVPEQAARLLSQSAPQARLGMIGEIAANWSGSDPARTIAWASQLPSAEERTIAWQKLTENWSATHPVEAATWLKTLPAGVERDSAAATYARTVMGIDPDAAIAWAGSIANPAQRTDTLRKAYLHWRQFDPDAAHTWLETAPDFPEEAKLKLQNEP
jgi:hypothetical protein